MRPFDTALSCRGIRAHDLDPELVERATILRHPVAADTGALVDVENGVLVALERHRFSMAFYIEWLAQKGTFLLSGKRAFLFGYHTHCRRQLRMSPFSAK